MGLNLAFNDLTVHDHTAVIRVRWSLGLTDLSLLIITAENEESLPPAATLGLSLDRCPWGLL